MWPDGSWGKRSSGHMDSDEAGLEAFGLMSVLREIYSEHGCKLALKLISELRMKRVVFLYSANKTQGRPKGARKREEQKIPGGLWNGPDGQTERSALRCGVGWGVVWWSSGVVFISPQGTGDIIPFI